jgi:hypothetical protein
MEIALHLLGLFGIAVLIAVPISCLLWFLLKKIEKQRKEMKVIDIRHALEEKVKELGGTIRGGGSLMVPPYTMDFEFELNDKKYVVNLWDKEQKDEYRRNNEN